MMPVRGVSPPLGRMLSTAGWGHGITRTLTNSPTRWARPATGTAILAPTRSQVNEKGLLREAHTAEEGLVVGLDRRGR